MIHDDWARWTKASFADFFSDGCQELEIGFFFDNEQKDIPATNKTYLELRLDGPDYDEITTNETLLKISLQMGLHVGFDSKLFTPEYYSGRIQALCAGCIPFRKIGLPEDDGSTIDFFSRSKDDSKIRSLQVPLKTEKVQVAEFIILANYELRIGV